ncbi:MAG: ATP-binding protein [Nitrospira sp.]
MGSLTERPAIAERILRELCAIAECRQGILYVLDRERGCYDPIMTAGFRNPSGVLPSFSSSHPLPQALAQTHSLLKLSSIEDPTPLASAWTAAFESPGLSLAIPLMNKERLVALALLGGAVDRLGAQHGTDDLLKALAQTAANALDAILVRDDLHQSQALMRRTDRLRSLEIIAGGFAHEIRNPLTSIKTFIQLAPERKDDAEFIRDFSRIVLEDVYRIERLIQEILDYARYMEPKLTDEDLNEIVASCLYFIEVKADSKRIKIEKQLASELPRVMLDRQQIKQVLLNLLLNAIDAMGDEGGTLKVRTSRLIKPGAPVWARVEIEDSGHGISKANLEHIFDPFFTTKHTSGEHAGTGLGLTIVHQIIREHQGDIQVDSTEGVGTTFFVNLPAIPME